MLSHESAPQTYEQMKQMHNFLIRDTLTIQPNCRITVGYPRLTHFSLMKSVTAESESES